MQVIQRLSNRLIFIRNCEDRRWREASLRAALHQWRQRGRVGADGGGARVCLLISTRRSTATCCAFHEVDRVLGSQVSQHDRQLEDTLGDIVGGLYTPPRSLAAYDFSVIDADASGRVYEQYLGVVAEPQRRGRPGRATVEAGGGGGAHRAGGARQRRKEHGIYYTPKWAVDYIVRKTRWVAIWRSTATTRS